MKRTLFLLILLALVGAVSAVPFLPAEFSGTATIDGSPAPAGTVITARIDDRDCGSLTLANAGVFGGETLYDERLIVNGEDTDAGETITFFVDGVPAGTAVYASGTSTTIALAATKGGTSSGSSGSSSGASGSTPSTTPTATVTEPTESSTPGVNEAATVVQETPAPLADPTLTFGPVASATAVQYAGLPFSWLTGLATLAGAAFLVRMHRRG